MPINKYAAALAALMAAMALPVQAYEQGDWIVRVGAANVDPDTDSDPIDVAGLATFPNGVDVDDDTRQGIYEAAWEQGGHRFIFGSFRDITTDIKANDTASDFIRSKISEIVKDPETAELLSPKDVFGCKRLCVDTGYFETYNRPNVKLVDISHKGVERITPKGLMANGEEFEVDAIVCATGFAAMTGSFDKIDIRGRDGLTLKKAWEAGLRTYLGLSTVGFPNFFMITGPGSPSVLAQMIQSIEQHADWMIDCLCHMRDTGADMKTKYKETARGGLAVNVIEC